MEFKKVNWRGSLEGHAALEFTLNHHISGFLDMKEALRVGDKESEVYKNACSVKVESIYILFTCYLQFPMDTRCSINVC